MIKKANIGTIARAASLVIVFFALSRMLGLVRDVVVASQFGTSLEYDAYLAAFKLPDFLFNVISGGALGSAFIPTFTGFLTRKDRVGAWRLASAIINWLLLILVGMGILSAIFAPQLVRWVIAPGFSDAAQLALTINIMRLLMLSMVVFGISGLVMGILQAHQHFLLPALAPVVYNLAIIAGAWFLGPHIGVYGLAFGVVVGSLLHLTIQLPGLAKYNARYVPILGASDAGVREVARLMGPRMLGLAAIQLNFWWDTILASWLSQGSLSSLDYGRRLMLLPQGIIAQAVAAAAFPTFSALAADEAWDELQSAFISTLRGVLYISIPAAIGLIFLGKPIIEVLYQRNAFDEQSTQATLWALVFYTIGLVSHSMVEILTRAFYALKNTKIPVMVGIASMVINVVLSVALLNGFSNVGWAPHGGIALASSIAVTVEMVWLVAMLRRLPGQLSMRPLLIPSLKMFVAGGIMGVGLWALQQTVLENLQAWLIVGIGIASGVGVYLLMSLILRIDEISIVKRLVLRKLKNSD